MAGPNMDQFEAYFKRADLDQDGRISEAEAVAFFQGSALSKQVLAQIWTYADQNRSGFLGRPEFFNALKLVTVAQSKRELTPEIVRAALYGPASSKIPPPQINLPPSPMPQPSPMSTSPAMQMGAMTPRPSQNLGYRGSVPPNQNMNQQYYPSHGNQLIRLSQGLPTSSAPLPAQSTPGLPNSGISSAGFPSSGMLSPGRPGSMSTHGLPSSGMSTPGLPSSGMSIPAQPNPSMSAGWLGGRPNGPPSGPTSQVPIRGISPSIPSVSPKPQFPSQSANNDSRVIPVSGNGFPSNSIGGGDPFADFQTITKPAASPSTPSLPASSAIVRVSGPPPVSSTPTSSAIVPVSSATQPTSTSRSLESLQSAFAKQPLGGQPQQAQVFSSLTQPVPQVTSSGVLPGNSAGAGNSVPDQSQPPWPKMTTPGIQKYTKVFMEVDSDRDGKITGEQARNLFLSWRLPRGDLNAMYNTQRKYDPYSTYNQGWRDIANMSNARQPPQPQGQDRTQAMFEQLLKKMDEQKRDTDTKYQALEGAIKQLQQRALETDTTIGNLQAQLRNCLPSQPFTNPKDNVSAITLRSGRELKPRQQKVQINEEEQETELGDPKNIPPTSFQQSQCQLEGETRPVEQINSEGELKQKQQQKKSSESAGQAKYQPKPPFPTRFAKSKKDEANAEILETFRKVEEEDRMFES